jgi:hypothetical protein
MAQRFNASRWQDFPARRIGQEHMLRVIRASVGEDHPDYRDLEARRQQPYPAAGPERSGGINDSRD